MYLLWALVNLHKQRRVRFDRISMFVSTILTDQLSSVQVNLAAETGDMGVLANHVPSIEQLKPGLVEVIEESGGSKQFFCMYRRHFGNLR